MNNKQQLIRDFIRFVMENYRIQLTATESDDAETFETLFSDLAKVLEKENDTDI